MKYSVAYFSRTGNSGRIAQKIAQKLSTDAIEVTDNMNWKGPIGYIRAGRCALNTTNPFWILSKRKRMKMRK